MMAGKLGIGCWLLDIGYLHIQHAAPALKPRPIFVAITANAHDGAADEAAVAETEEPSPRDAEAAEAEAAGTSRACDGDAARCSLVPQPSVSPQARLRQWLLPPALLSVSCSLSCFFCSGFIALTLG